MMLARDLRLGPYEIQAPLGQGGMGKVYRAIDTRLGRPVAIKVLPRHVADSPTRCERFEREARALSSLSDPHICPLYDIGEQDGLPFLVMEALDGETLAELWCVGPFPSIRSCAMRSRWPMPSITRIDRA
jgi:eukaryotic-like serine/threonine-protein kinase